MNQEKSRRISTPQESDPNFVSHAATQMRDEESLRDVLLVLRKRKYFVLAVTLGVVAVVLLACLVMRPEYTSTATLLVDKESGSGLDLGSLSSLASAVGGQDDLKVELTTHGSILQSDSNVLAVYNELNLQNVAPYKYEPRSLDFLQLGVMAGKLRAERGIPIEKAPATRERYLSYVHKHLKVEYQQDSRLVTIEYRDYDPERAAVIANSLVDNYLREYLHTRYQATARATDWLSGQLGALKKNVDDTQKKLSDYEHESGLSVLMLGLSIGGGESGGSGGGSAGGGGVHIPAIDRLAALNQELTTAEANRIAKEAIYRLTQTQSPEVVLGLGSSPLSAMGGGSAVINQGSGLEVLQSLRQQEAAVKMNYADIATKYGAKNPRLAEVQGQISALDGQIKAELKRINERALNDFTLAQKSEDGIRRDYGKQEEAVSKTNDGMIQLEILAGEALSSRALYEGLTTKLQAAGVEAGVKATNLSLVDPARPPAKQSRPDWLLYPAIALGAGLLLGIGGAFVKENLDDAVVTSENVERISGYPVMANIPLIHRDDLKSAMIAPGEVQDQSLLLSAPQSPIAESYRSLRTSIQLSAIDKPLQVLLVSSPLGGDGKSTVSYNTSIAFAQQGKRVLVMDADQRKSRMHRMFRVERSPGLSELLSGQTTLEAVVRPHNSVEGLFLLPAGISPPNPADLLGSHRFDELLALLRTQYDLVIIDSPPILLVTDAVILSAKADGMMVVVRSGVTTKPVLTHVSDVLRRRAGHIFGFVLNAVDTRSVEYYYSYGYYGGSKYYGEEDSKS
jgi:capsular exopolysaccharide synthesis family protein